MAQSFSFDVTSTIDLQEVDNAVNQARKELGQRYDFKGSPATIELDQKAGTLTLTAEDAFKLGAVWEIVQTRLVRRSVPVKNMKPGETEHASAGTVRQVITLQQGIPTDASREIVKFLKDRKLKKVQASIQGDQLRAQLALEGRSAGGDGAAARAGLRRGAAVRQLPIVSARGAGPAGSRSPRWRPVHGGLFRRKAWRRAFPGYSGGRSHPPDRTLAARRPRT